MTERDDSTVRINIEPLGLIPERGDRTPLRTICWLSWSGIIIASFASREIDRVLHRFYYDGPDSLLILTDAGVEAIATCLVRERRFTARNAQNRALAGSHNRTLGDNIRTTAMLGNVSLTGLPDGSERLQYLWGHAGGTDALGGLSAGIN